MLASSFKGDYAGLDRSHQGENILLPTGRRWRVLAALMASVFAFLIVGEQPLHSMVLAAPGVFEYKFNSRSIADKSRVHRWTVGVPDCSPQTFLQVLADDNSMQMRSFGINQSFGIELCGFGRLFGDGNLPFASAVQGDRSAPQTDSGYRKDESEKSNWVGRRPLPKSFTLLCLAGGCLGLLITFLLLSLE